MGKITLSGFGGIAPRYGDLVKPGMATVARDCDLSGKQISARSADLTVAMLSGNYDSIVKFGGSWLGGNNACFLTWKIDETEMLIYLSGGTLVRRIGSTTVNVGQEVPAAPTVAEGNAGGSLDGTYRYLVTMVREVDDYEDESGPSEPSSEITVDGNYVTVSISSPSDSNITKWRLYRLSLAVSDYLLVAEVAIGTTSYSDGVADTDLGIVCPTWYTSSQGNEILIGPPPTELDGLAPDLFGGMLFAWKDSRLYFCEPGTPDFWPAIYYLNFRTDIKQVVPFAGSLAVLCEDGPYRVDGTHPELLHASKPLGKEPCLAAASCNGARGVYYLSDSGIALYNLVDSVVITNEAFTEDWFKENVGYAGVKLAVVDDKLILFHNAGALCFDETVKQWSTMAIEADAVWVNPEDGGLYYLQDGTVKLLYGGSARVACTWKSGKLYGKSPFNENAWLQIMPIGNGTVTLSAWVDGALVIDGRTVDMDAEMERDQRTKFPAGCSGKVMQLQVDTSSAVEAVMVDYA